MGESIETIGQNIAYNFGVLGLTIDFVKAEQSPLGCLFFFNLQNIADYNEGKIKDIIKKQSVYFHADWEMRATKEAHFAIFIYSKEKVKLSLIGLLQKTIVDKKMYIGKDSENKLVSLDFNKIPHLLIGGTTGSGKTILLKNIICNILCYTKAIQQKRAIYIIDTKYELNQFKGKAVIINDANQAVDKLKRLAVLMDDFYKGIYKKDQFGELFIIIDELADLMLTSKYEVEESIVRIAQKGRACGFHLIVATQSPRVAVISGLIKANMPYRIALKTASTRDSIVILDHKGAETLRGNGDCIFKNGLEETHLQVAYAEKELIEQLVKVC